MAAQFHSSRGCRRRHHCIVVIVVVVVVVGTLKTYTKQIFARVSAH